MLFDMWWYNCGPHYSAQKGKSHYKDAHCLYHEQCSWMMGQEKGSRISENPLTTLGHNGQSKVNLCGHLMNIMIVLYLESKMNACPKFLKRVSITY